MQTYKSPHFSASSIYLSRSDCFGVAGFGFCGCILKATGCTPVGTLGGSAIGAGLTGAGDVGNTIGDVGILGSGVGAGDRAMLACDLKLSGVGGFCGGANCTGEATDAIGSEDGLCGDEESCHVYGYNTVQTQVTSN